MGGHFSFARSEGYPTMFPEMKTPVTVDVLEAGFISIFVILALCFYIVIPGSRGHFYRWNVFFRVTLKLLFGAILMTSNFGQHWEVGSVNTTTPYKAGSPHEINAIIGVKIGLRSVNITLVRDAKPEPGEPLQHEIINYNERFWWTWDQGRFGFGPYAGILQRSFRDAQRKGLPIPILWIADYFTWDGEGLRYGRFYRTAGWYSHIAMWAAFPCWVLANFFFLFTVRYGAYFTIFSGLFQLLACILWAVIRNPHQLEIPFEDGTLTLKFGTNFWITIVAGITSTLLGLLLIFFDLRYPDETAVFFGLDPLSDYEEYHLTAAELESVRRKKKTHNINLLDMNQETNSQTGPPDVPVTQVVFKRRTTVKYGQKELIRTPPYPIIAVEEEEDNYDDAAPMYLNVPQTTHLHPSKSTDDRIYSNV